MRLTKAARAAANLDLILKLWAYGPHRDLRYLVANFFGDRASLRLACQVMATLDREQFRQLASRHPHESGNLGASKYLCVGAPLVRAAFNAQMLRLHQRSGLKVLDIGAGAGFFSFVANHLGHEAHAVDIDEEALYRETTSLLAIPRTIHRVTLESPLPQLPTKYDLVVAFQLLFDRDESLPGGIWRVPEWQHFMTTLRTNYLTESGSVFVGLNSGIDDGLLSELHDYFYSLGCRRLANGYHVTFDGG